MIAFGTVSGSLSGQALTAVRLTSSEQVSEALADLLRSRETGQYVAEPPQRAVPEGGPPAPQRPADMLTEAELKALMGEDS